MTIHRARGQGRQGMGGQVSHPAQRGRHIQVDIHQYLHTTSTISRQDSREPWVTVVSGTRVGVMAGVAWDTALPAATTVTGSMDTSCRPGIYTVSNQYL